MTWISAAYEPEIAKEVALDFLEKEFVVTPTFRTNELSGYWIESPKATGRKAAQLAKQATRPNYRLASSAVDAATAPTASR